MAKSADTESADALLLQRALAGDETAFGSLVQQHYDAIFRRVMAITRNEHDARDVCQEVWVTVWRSLRDFRGDAQFATWVYSIATRRAIDHLRKRRRWFDRFLPFRTAGEDSSVETLEPPSTAPGPRDQAESAEAMKRFERAIAALPPKHQAVLALREIENLSYEEIARTLKCRTGTVMSRLFTARRLLAKQLGDLPCD